jgi:hypothetical protein
LRTVAANAYISLSSAFRAEGQNARRSSRTSCMIVAAISSIDFVVDDSQRML